MPLLSKWPIFDRILLITVYLNYRYTDITQEKEYEPTRNSS